TVRNESQADTLERCAISPEGKPGRTLRIRARVPAGTRASFSRPVPPGRWKAPAEPLRRVSPIQWPRGFQDMPAKAADAASSQGLPFSQDAARPGWRQSVRPFYTWER